MYKPVVQVSPAKSPREIASNLLDSYQQMWWQPFDASAGMKGIDLPRTGKNDLGSVLFDNAMMQIETLVKFAGSLPAMAKRAAEMLSTVLDPKARESRSSMISACAV